MDQTPRMRLLAGLGTVVMVFVAVGCADGGASASRRVCDQAGAAIQAAITPPTRSLRIDASYRDGANEIGRLAPSIDDARLRSLARAFARTGRSVVDQRDAIGGPAALALNALDSYCIAEDLI